MPTASDALPLLELAIKGPAKSIEPLPHSRSIRNKIGKFVLCTACASSFEPAKSWYDAFGRERRKYENEGPPPAAKVEEMLFEWKLRSPGPTPAREASMGFSSCSAYAASGL
jgi:hypothetical protein